MISLLRRNLHFKIYTLEKINAKMHVNVYVITLFLSMLFHINHTVEVDLRKAPYCPKWCHPVYTHCHCWWIIQTYQTLRMLALAWWWVWHHSLWASTTHLSIRQRPCFRPSYLIRLEVICSRTVQHRGHSATCDMPGFEREPSHKTICASRPLFPGRSNPSAQTLCHATVSVGFSLWRSDAPTQHWRVECAGRPWCHWGSCLGPWRVQDGSCTSWHTGIHESPC